MTTENLAASADAGATSPDYLTEDAAAASIENLLGLDDEEEEGTEAAAQPDPEPEAEEPAAEDESAEPTDEPSEPEAEPEADKLAHGNQKTRLRDGKEVTVGELKKAYDEAQELKAQRQEWERQQAAFREHAQRAAQQEQFFHQNIQNAIAIQQAALGNPPDPALRDTDPIEYFTQKDRFESKRAELGRLIQAQQTAMAERQRQMQGQQKQTEDQRKQQMQAYVQEQQTKLYERMPELREPEVAKKFYADVVEGVKAYGFEPDDVNAVSDARLLPLIKDALAYRKLQAAKPVAQAKAKAAAPVQPPGRRVSANEAQARDRAGKLDQLRKTGRLQDAASLLEDLI